MKYYFLLISFIFLFLSTNAQRFTKLNPEDFKIEIEQSTVQIIDLRPPGSFIQEHIASAENIDVEDRKFEQEILTLDKTIKTFIYCEDEKKSTKAAKQLEELGFTKIYILAGGWEAWKNAKLNTSNTSDLVKMLNLDMNQFNQLIRKDKLVLVDFTANWCLPCKMLKPRIEKLAAENKDLKVLYIDVDKNQSLANQLDIHSIPYLHYYVNGKMVRLNNGLLSDKELKKFIR